ncbi:MAG: LamG-like jellyroll fold domain-containing protein [Haloarculaceae archaeon]
MAPTAGRPDERGLSSTVSYVLALGITTLLVTSLVFAMGGFLESEADRATRQQLDALGARLAEDVAAADRLARAGGNASVAVEAPDRVVGVGYTVGLEHGSACDSSRFAADTCLVLRAADRGITVRQPLANDSALALAGSPGADLVVRANTTGSATRGFAADPDVPATVGIGAISGAGTGATVVGNTDPIAGFIFSPGDPVTGTNISFRNDTEDLDGVITTYEWSFELPGGGNATRVGRTTNFSYDTPGVYTVTLEVTDDEGETDSVRRRVPVSGLVYREDASPIDYDGDGRAGGVELSFDNTWGSSVEVLTVGIDPGGPSGAVAELSEGESGDGSGDHEVRFEAPPTDPGSGGEDGYVDYDGGSPLSFPTDGAIVDLDADGDDRGTNPVVGSGEVLALELSELVDGSGTDLDDAADEPLDLAVRYRVDGDVYVTKVTLFDLDDGPTVSWVSAADWDATSAARNVTHPDDRIRLDAPGPGGLPTADMRVWLPLNESGSPSETLDYAGGTVYEFDVRGDPTTGAAGFDGGAAYEFDGSDDWLLDGNAESTYLQNEESVTVSMWVKAEATGTNAGLVDSVDDGGESDDDEFGLRYDSSGADAGGTDSFKSSVGIQGDSTEYNYEYESNVQSTRWQHLAMRWESGERIELFVNGTELAYRTPLGGTPPGVPMENVEFLALARSQKDDTGALWDGRIDEVRIYDRALSADEIDSLASNSGLRQGSFNTSWKTTSRNLDLSDLRLGYDVGRDGGTVRVTVYTRRDDGSVAVSDPVRLNGDSGVKEVEGLTGGTDEFRLHVEFAATSGTPSADEFTLGD